MAGAAFAGGPVLTRQAAKGTLLVVSNLDRGDYEDFLARMLPQYVIWTTPMTPRDHVALPPGHLAMVLFLFTSLPEPVAMDGSWVDSLPVPTSDLNRPGIIIASKIVAVPGQGQPSVGMLIQTPNEQLLRITFEEALRYEHFPLKKPIIREVADLRHVRSIASLPTVAPSYLASVGSAAEYELYSELLRLRAFQVVGREAMPIAAGPRLVSADRLQELGRELRVQAVALVQLEEAETICEEHTEFRKSKQKRVSAEKQKAYDDIVAKLMAEGKPLPRRGPKADLVWAAPYLVRRYTTRVTGAVRIIDTETGRDLVTHEIDGKLRGNEEDEGVRKFDYRWYKMDDIDDRDARNEDEYRVRLRDAAAIQVARDQVIGFGKLLAARAILPSPGDLDIPEPPPVEPREPVAKILEVVGNDVFINLGRKDGIQEGDAFVVWGEKQLKDPDTGRVIETIRAEIAGIRVKGVYERTSLCYISTRPSFGSLAPGMEVVRERRGQVAPGGAGMY
jgi:hypothetical protein